MRITLAQLNPTVGDIQGNMLKMIDAWEQGSRGNSDLVVFPELFLPGYPPRDLLEKAWFIEQNQQALQKIINVSGSYSHTGILFGIPQINNGTGKGLYNSALLVYRGQILASRHKSLLPVYDFFDEARYFDPAPDILTVPFKEEVLGISICEDAWNDPRFWNSRSNYSFNPIAALAAQGATLLINISASPFHAGKEETRYRLICNHARRHALPFIYVNQVGANDELIFDGRSMCIDRSGKPFLTAPAYEEYQATVDTRTPGSERLHRPDCGIESVYRALGLGIKDYVRKCGFKKVLIGLSGGIDSALTACLAVQAVGKENVRAISMPSPFSSSGSVDDSRKLAQNLGIECNVLPIGEIYHSYVRTLGDASTGESTEITLGNIQARIRGSILMAISNKYGYLLLSTGNKSELAVGYCTLYGDMSGGLNVLADVPKTTVYELAHYINRDGELIPHEILSKPPSAELKPGQTDQDELPPYDILDLILHYYIEGGYSPQQIIDLGFGPVTVKWVIQAVDQNEYKRRQAAPGLKITAKAFGIGRRMPVAAHVKHF
ncbi:NAD+ synthase [Syntrophomonas curvata]